MEDMLETHALCKRYRNFTALNGLDMHIPKGSIYGFAGRNGAGKTTLIRLICGLQLPTSGGYTLYGVRNTDAATGRCRRRMGAVVESPAIYPDMTAEENLRQQALVLGLPSDGGAKALLQLVGLGDTGRKKAKNFSLGMRQRLGIAIALTDSPELLVLDEPVNGLDPQGIIEMRELILKLNREQGITVLISSHILDELSHLATHYGFIDGGRMVKEMSAGELEARCRKCMRLDVSDTRACARAGPAEGRIPHRRRHPRGSLHRAPGHGAGAGAGQRALRGAQHQGARRESRELLYASDRRCAPCVSCFVRTVPACSATGPSGCSRR